MKPILKDHQAQRSKGTLTKAPLRVTFTFDETNTQKESLPFTQPFSWMRQNSQARQDDNQIIKDNAKEVKAVKKEDFWKEEGKFKRENIQWNNFVLVYNPKFTLSNFFCGNCQKSYDKIVDFTFHCLTECGEILHQKSSHFIFDQKDWRSFVNKQLAKAAQPKEPKIPNIPNNSKAFEERMKEIRAFTETTLSFWRQTGQKQIFKINQHYNLLHNFIILLNPLLQDYSLQHITQVRSQCPHYNKWYNLNKASEFILYHFYDRKCCKVNTLDSKLLILDAEMFHNYLIETGRFKLEDKRINISCLVYYYNKHQKQVEKMYPKFKYYKIYIEIFYEMRETLEKAPVDKALLQQYGKAQIQIFLKFHRYFKLVHLWENFKNETFYCPCQNFSTPMTISQFAVHLIKTPHKIIKLIDLLSK